MWYDVNSCIDLFSDWLHLILQIYFFSGQVLSTCIQFAFYIVQKFIRIHFRKQVGVAQTTLFTHNSFFTKQKIDLHSVRADIVDTIYLLKFCNHWLGQPALRRH